MIKERVREAMVGEGAPGETAPPVVRLEGLCKAFEEGGRQRVVLDKVDYPVSYTHLDVYKRQVKVSGSPASVPNRAKPIIHGVSNCTTLTPKLPMPA